MNLDQMENAVNNTPEKAPLKEECTLCWVAAGVAAGITLAGVGVYSGMKIGQSKKGKSIAQTQQNQSIEL